MIYTLLFLSFLAHFAMIYVIIHLFQRVKHLESQDPVSQKRDIEETLTAYITDIKEENESFLNAIQKKQQPKEERAPLPEVKPSKPVEEVSYHPPTPEQDDMFEQSLTSQVLTLSNQGFSVTEIAQKLNKGKGEVQLLLKLKKKN